MFIVFKSIWHGLQIRANEETDEEKRRYVSALRRRQLSLLLAGRMKPDDATELKALFVKD